MSDDLISRKVVSEALKNYFASMIDKRKYNIDTVDCNADLQKIVTNIDTAYDVDKVVEQLQNDCHNYYPSIDYYCMSQKVVKLNDALNIVKGAVKDE
jgi:hypothetical protein